MNSPGVMRTPGCWLPAEWLPINRRSGACRRNVPKFELRSFDSDKIQHFVTAWYDEMAERWKEPRERTREFARPS